MLGLFLRRASATGAAALRNQRAPIACAALRVDICPSATVAAAAAAAATAAAATSALADAAPSSSACLSRSFIADAAAAASPALVNIRVGSGWTQSSGSGFVVESSGLILTNTHVVRDAMRSGGGTVSVTLSDGVSELRGVVQHADSVSDIAVVRVTPRAPLPAVKLGTSASLRPGEFVVALGAPAGLSNSVSAGIVSAVERTRSELGLREPRGRASAGGSGSYIQTDAAINAGVWRRRSPATPTLPASQRPSHAHRTCARPPLAQATPAAHCSTWTAR